jgi:cell division protein FtsB
MDTQINVEVVLKSLREQIGAQAQEVAMLKATIAALNDKLAETKATSEASE